VPELVGQSLDDAVGAAAASEHARARIDRAAVEHDLGADERTAAAGPGGVESGLPAHADLPVCLSRPLEIDAREAPVAVASGVVPHRRRAQGELLEPDRIVVDDQMDGSDRLDRSRGQGDADRRLLGADAGGGERSEEDEEQNPDRRNRFVLATGGGALHGVDLLFFAVTADVRRE